MTEGGMIGWAGRVILGRTLYVEPLCSSLKLGKNREFLYGGLNKPQGSYRIQGDWIECDLALGPGRK